VPLLDVILGYDCNLFCDYCTITPQMRERALSTRAVAQALRHGRAAGYDAVSFTGGEPTLRGDLLALVRLARRLGYTDVKVQSNGLLLAHAPNVDRLVEAGANRFHVSIHAHERERYERMVRREGTHAAMMAGLEQLVARDVILVADVILMESTYRVVVDALSWLHGIGIRAADLWFVSLTDHNRDNLASLPRMTDVVPFMREAFAWARAHGMTLRSLHVPRCLLGDDHVHAWDPAAQGVRVVTPDATFELTGSRLTGQVHVPACAGCAFEHKCLGLRPDYLEVYGDGEIAAARGQSPTLSGRRRLPITEGRPID
jgi:MoaA/NifB/PqqE/SkfB family radical SAM enzyme